MAHGWSCYVGAPVGARANHLFLPTSGYDAMSHAPRHPGNRLREISEARLLVLEEAATAIPDAAAGQVATAMLAL